MSGFHSVAVVRREMTAWTFRGAITSWRFQVVRAFPVRNSPYRFSDPVWLLGWRSMAAFLLLALVTLIVRISGAINKQIQYSCSAMLWNGQCNLLAAHAAELWS